METPVIEVLFGEEECCVCKKKLGYPKDLHIDDPLRLGNYTEGVGQACVRCSREMYSRPARIFLEEY